MRFTRSSGLAFVVVVAVAASFTAACTALLGSYEVNGGASGGVEAGTTEGGSSEAGADDGSMRATDGSVDARPPVMCTGTQVACGGDCAELDSDAKHCGACGHSCLGGVCSSKVCTPFVLSARNDVNATVIAANDTEVFFSTLDNKVVQVPGTMGGAAVTLADVGTANTVTAIATGGVARVFFLSFNGSTMPPQSQVWKATVGLAGSGGTINPPFAGKSVGLVLAGPNLISQHITTPAGAATESFELEMCSAGTGAACYGTNPQNGRPGTKLAEGNGYVFWTDKLGNVYARNETGGAATAVVGGQTPDSPAWDGTTLFFQNAGAGTIYRFTYPNPVITHFRTLGSGSGASANDLLVDGVNVYWSEYNGTQSDLFALPKTASQNDKPITLASGTIGRLAQTLDGVYWADSSGVHGVRKP